MLRRTLMVATACAVLAVVAGLTPAHAAPSSTQSCTVAPPDRERLGTTLTPDGGPAYARWLEADANRNANLAIQEATHAVFGITDSKLRTADTVRRGLIGSTVDHNSQTVVVVVTPDYRTDADALRNRLASARASVSSAGLKVEVKVGCYTANQLAEADDILWTRSWHPDAKQASFSYWLAADDSRFHVSFDPRYPEAAEALRRQLGDVVAVTLDGATRTGRLDDGLPHYGGSGVRAHSGPINSNDCTTGFIVRRNSDGRLGGVTAGHCFENGDPIYSSTKYWGEAWGESNYPVYDMMGITSATQTYDNVIHVDPCCPTKRYVTGRRSPVENDVVCLSGMTTRAICGIRVTRLNGHICDPPDVCTYGLMVGERNGEVISRGGDSGGPVYIRSGTNNAIVLGIIIGGGTSVLAEQMHNIERHLGVTVLTS